MPDLSELLERAAGGPAAPPNLQTIDRRARVRTVARRAGGIAAVFAVLGAGVLTTLPSAPDPGIALGSRPSVTEAPTPAGPMPGFQLVSPQSPPPEPPPSEYPTPEGTPQPAESPHTYLPPVDAQEEQGAVRPIPPAPIGPRYDPATTYAGGELVVLGGSARVGPGEPPGEGDDQLDGPTWDEEVMADGARYDPERDTWRPIPAPREGLVITELHAAGRQVLATGWTGLADPAAAGPVALWAGMYDLDEDRWQEVPPAPLSLRDQSAVTWTGSQLVLWGGYGTSRSQTEPGGPVMDDGAVYDLASNTWRPMADGPLLGGSVQGTIWTGREVVFQWGYVDVDELPVWVAYDPASDAWRDFPAPSNGANVTVNAGADLVAFGTGHDENERGEAIFSGTAQVYEAATGAWRDLGVTALPARSGPGQTSWTGSRLVVSVGSAGHPLYALEPATGRWSRLPNPSDGRAEDSMTGGDGRVFSWGGLDDGGEYVSSGGMLELP